MPPPYTTQTPQETPTPIITRTTRKNVMNIAIIGDSMVDTLGPDLPDCVQALKTTYPKATITFTNFGVGGTNIDYGIKRLTGDYDYLGIHHASLVSTHPDAVIIESFGYNPYSYDVGALDAHWLALAKMVDIVKANLPGAPIVIASTIAPNNTVFGDGAAGLAFSAQDKRERTAVIKRYLESTVAFAQSQHLPLVDAYHPSMDAEGNGKIEYINAGDHIHYSPNGRIFMCSIIARTLVADKVLE
jgi:hypothetical protein